LNRLQALAARKADSGLSHKGHELCEGVQDQIEIGDVRRK
jgi:hypothetical protein